MVITMIKATTSKVILLGYAIGEILSRHEERRYPRKISGTYHIYVERLTSLHLAAMIKTM